MGKEGYEVCGIFMYNGTVENIRSDGGICGVPVPRADGD